MVSKSGSSDRAKKEALRKFYADYASGESGSHRNDTDFEFFRQFHKEGKLVIAKLAGNHRLSRLRRILHNGMQMYTVTTKGYL